MENTKRKKKDFRDDSLRRRLLNTCPPIWWQPELSPGEPGAGLARLGQAGRDTGASLSSTCSLLLKCSSAPLLNLQEGAGTAAGTLVTVAGPRHSALTAWVPRGRAGPGSLSTGRGRAGPSQLPSNGCFQLLFVPGSGSSEWQCSACPGDRGRSVASVAWRPQRLRGAHQPAAPRLGLGRRLFLRGRTQDTLRLPGHGGTPAAMLAVTTFTV